MMQVRGDILFSLRHYIELSYGVEGYHDWLNSLTIDSRKLYGPDLTASCWYPMEHSLIAPMERMCALFHEGDLTAAKDFGEHLADHLFWGKRVMMKMDEPEKVLKREGSSLLTFCGPGVVEAPLAAPCMTIIRLWRFQEMRPVLENFFGGYLERLAEHSGGEHAHYEISASLTNGSPYSELVVTWD